MKKRPIFWSIFLLLVIPLAFAFSFSDLFMYTIAESPEMTSIPDEELFYFDTPGGYESSEYNTLLIKFSSKISKKSDNDVISYLNDYGGGLSKIKNLEKLFPGVKDLKGWYILTFDRKDSNLAEEINKYSLVDGVEFVESNYIYGIYPSTESDYEYEIEPETLDQRIQEKFDDFLILGDSSCSDTLDNDGDGCIDLGQEPFDCLSEEDSEDENNCGIYPIDPLLIEQWAFHNIGHIDGIDDADIDAIEAWQIEEGSNEVLIAVVDTGVDYSHLDLKENIWTNDGETPNNGIDDDSNGFIDDYYGYDFCTYDSSPDWDPFDENGHGTGLAGIVAAETNNIIPDITDFGGGRVEDYSLVYNNFEGATLSTEPGYMVTTSPGTTSLYSVNIDQGYYSTYDSAPTNNPTGIALIGENYWISDPDQDLIYEFVREVQGYDMHKFRIIVTDSKDELDYEMLRISELELYNEGGTNYALASMGTTVWSDRTSYPPGQNFVNNINDGSTSTAFQVLNGDPITIEFTFSSVVEINRVVIRTQYGYYPIDYTLEYFDGSNWNTLLQVENNSQTLIEHELGTVSYIGSSFSSPGTDSRGLHWDGANLWNVDGDSDTIYKLNLAGLVVDSFYVGDLDNEPWGVTINGDYIFFSGDQNERTYQLNIADGSLAYYFDNALYQQYPGYSSKISLNRALVWDTSTDLLINVDDGYYSDIHVPDRSFFALVNVTPNLPFSGTGVAGTCPNCKVMSVKTLNYDGKGYADDIAQGIVYAVDNGADIILIGWGVQIPSLALRDAVNYAIDNDVILVASAGDESNDWEKIYPAAYEGVISVASTNLYDELDTSYPSYSSYNAIDDKWIDIGAPGQNIKSTACCGSQDYAFVQGTSSAASFVAGTLGLVKSHNPGWSDELIIGQVLSTTDSINVEFPDQYKDPDNLVGEGRLNAYNALNSAVGESIVLRSYDIEDVAGNEDGFLNPGETVRMHISLRNNWEDVNNVEARLTSSDPNIQIFRDESEYGDLNTLETGTELFTFRLSPAADYDQLIEFNLNVRVNGGNHRDIPVFVWVPHEYLPGWPKRPVVGSTWRDYYRDAVVDIDGNGDKEVLVYSRGSLSDGSDDYLNLFDGDGDVYPGWPVQISLREGSMEPVLADLDGDGRLEVFTYQKSSDDTYFEIHVFNHDGTEYTSGNWPLIVNSPFPGGDFYSMMGISIADVDNDASLEIFAVISGYDGDSDSGLVYGWDINGNSLSGFDPKIIDNLPLGAPVSFMDLDGNNDLELLGASSWGEYVYLWEHDGTNIDQFSYPFYYFYGAVPIADLDGDQTYEYFLQDYYSYHLADTNGNLLWSRGCPTPEDCYSYGASFGDLDGDGNLELVYPLTYINWSTFQETLAINVLNKNGTYFGDCWPLTYEEETSLDSVPLIADIDSDGFSEIIISLTDYYSGYGKVLAYNSDCSFVEGYPILVDKGAGAMTLTDVDGNGNLDLSLIHTESISIFDLGVEKNDQAMDWTMNRHDYQRSSNYDFIPKFPPRCSDDSAHGFCSFDKPKYCDAGNLVDNCQLCGCPSNRPICRPNGLCTRRGTHYNFQVAFPSGEQRFSGIKKGLGIQDLFKTS